MKRLGESIKGTCRYCGHGVTTREMRAGVKMTSHARNTGGEMCFEDDCMCVDPNPE